MGDKVVALILATENDDNKQSLTKKQVSSLVPFGAKYRLIDFTLSNCANSDVDVVDIFTNKEATCIKEYVSGGEIHGLNEVDYYVGKSDDILQLIQQNLDKIDKQNPDYVLILNGNHVYRMNYKGLVEYHASSKADCTAIVIEVEKKDASKFNILVKDKKGNVIKYEEKVKKPNGTSMNTGMYCFTWSTLKQYLHKENIIQELLKDKKKILTYRFEGYWREINNTYTYYVANIDVALNRWNNNLCNVDKTTTVYTESICSGPQYIGSGELVTNSVIDQGTTILGDCDACVIFRNVMIEEGAKVDHTVILPGAKIKKGAVVHNAIIFPDAVVEEEAEINTDSNAVILVN